MLRRDHRTGLFSVAGRVATAPTLSQVRSRRLGAGSQPCDDARGIVRRDRLANAAGLLHFDRPDNPAGRADGDILTVCALAVVARAGPTNLPAANRAAERQIIMVIFITYNVSPFCLRAAKLPPEIPSLLFHRFRSWWLLCHQPGAEINRLFPRRQGSADLAKSLRYSGSAGPGFGSVAGRVATAPDRP